RVSGVDGDGEAGVWNRRRSQRLRLPRFGPFVAVDGNGAAYRECGQADDVEGEIALAEERAPVGDHGWENLAILVAARGGLLALIPDGAAEREWGDRRKHAFVQDGRHHRPVLVSDWQRLRWTRIDTELCFPLAGKRNIALIAEREMQIFRLGEKTAIGLGFENANGDYILAGLESVAHRIHAWVLDPCTAAHGFAVDVDRVHALNLAEVEGGASSRERVGDSDLHAEPDKCRRIGHAQFRESAGDWHRFPRRVIVILSGPIVLLARVVLVIPVHDVVAVFGRAFGFQPVELCEWDIEVMERTKRVG